MESGAVDLLMKYVLMPLLGVLVGIVSWTAKKIDKRVTELEIQNGEMERKLLKDYYDREEIRKTIYEPLSSDIKETRDELKDLSGMVSDIHKDMAILKYSILGNAAEKKDQ